MGERICIMREGRIVQVGRPLDVYRSPVNTFVAGFLASPPMNLISARLATGVDGGLILEGGSLRLSIPQAYVEAYRPFAGRAVIFGIRAEDIHDRPAAADRQPLEASVIALEALGAEVVLILELASERKVEIAARLGRSYRAPIGSRQRLYLDLAEMQLFDPESTNAIPRPGARAAEGS